jgi:hypothetical protein
MPSISSASFERAASDIGCIGYLSIGMLELPALNRHAGVKRPQIGLFDRFCGEPGIQNGVSHVYGCDGSSAAAKADASVCR